MKTRNDANSDKFMTPPGDWHRSPKSPLVNEPYGMRITDVPIIDRGCSVWSIDDSGTPFVGRGASDYFTLVAATTVGDVDLESILGSVTQFDGESRFNKLRVNNPKECFLLMNALGRESILGLCLPKYKEYRPHKTAYSVFYSKVERLIQMIQKIDHSQRIVVLVDKNNYLNFKDYVSLSTHHTIVTERDSCDFRIIQLADAIVSSLGHALLPDGTGTTIYFDAIRERCINLSEGGGTCTQQTRNFTLDSNSSSCKDKKHSATNKQESKSKRMRNGVGVWRHSIWRGKR